VLKSHCVGMRGSGENVHVLICAVPLYCSDEPLALIENP
jgi:hypothetical protein